MRAGQQRVVGDEQDFRTRSYYKQDHVSVDNDRANKEVVARGRRGCFQFRPVFVGAAMSRKMRLTPPLPNLTPLKDGVVTFDL